jgi:hypothetical protein
MSMYLVIDHLLIGIALIPPLGNIPPHNSSIRPREVVFRNDPARYIYTSLSLSFETRFFRNGTIHAGNYALLFEVSPEEDETLGVDDPLTIAPPMLFEPDDERYFQSSASRTLASPLN